MISGSPQNGQNRDHRGNGNGAPPDKRKGRRLPALSELKEVPEDKGSPDPESNAALHAWFVTLILVLTPLAVLWYHRLQVDDPYITYRYAQNLAEGRGWVYNDGVRILGTTSPLYAMLLAIGGGLTTNLPFVSSILSGISLGALAFIIYGLLYREREGLAGGLAALLVVANPLLGDNLGFELNLFLALGFGGLLAYRCNRAATAAVLLALATLARGDGFLPAILVLAHCVWSQGRRAWLPIFLFGAIVAAWMGYAIGVFGSPFPNTLAAKQALAQSGLWRPYWRGAARIVWIYIGQSPLFLWFAVCALFGLTRMLGDRKRKPGASAVLWMVPGWALLTAIGYMALGVAEGVNYYAALVPALCMLAGLGVLQLADVIEQEWSKPRLRPNWIVFAVFFPLAAASLTPAIRAAADEPEPRYLAYREAAEWITVGTDPDATIGMLEIGIVGYYSRRTIVDMCGLVTAGVSQHVAQGDLTWAIRSRKPDYVLLHDPAWKPEEPVANAEWFSTRYLPVKRFSTAEPYRLTLYKKQK